MIPFLMKWWLDPARVMLVFNASIWWPRALASLVFSPLVCLMMSVFLGYILQAAALLIRSPLALAGFVAVCHTLSWAVADHHPLSWQYWSAAIFLFVLVVCVARDNGMEIYCGAQIAVELISNLVLRVGGERASAHTLFWAPHRSTSPLWFVISAVLTAAFYLILFGRTGIPATWRLGRLWGRP